MSTPFPVPIENRAVIEYAVISSDGSQGIEVAQKKRVQNVTSFETSLKKTDLV